MRNVKSGEDLVEVPGGTVFVRRWHPLEKTNKPPVVLLHDSLGCVELWRDFPAQLAQHIGCEVIAYDRLGFGQSTKRVDPPTHRFIDEEAESVFPALCSALGLKKVIPFGHSVGGCMAIAIAGIHSQSNLCAAVVTESAQAFVEERTRSGVEAAKRHFSEAGHFGKLRKYHGSKARWVLEAWTETWLHPQFESWSLRAHLKNVRCPLLAIHGDNDEFGSVAFPRFIADEAAGQAQAVVLEGFGHVPHKENPATILTTVSGFFSRCFTSSLPAG